MGERTPKILFACSNENQVKVFLPLAKEFCSRDIDPVFLSFDRYYAQSASSALSKTEMSWIELQCSSEVAAWWSLTSQQQRPFLREAKLELDTVLVDTAAVALIVGNDLGPLEQLSIRAAENLGVRTVYIQDGICALKPFNPKERVFAPQMCDGGCELLCVWSDYISGGARQRGAGGEISTTGSLRYDLLSEWPGYKPHSGPYSVMVATQCLSKYGQMKPGQEIAIYERILRQLLTRSDVSVILKLHPQTNILEAYRDMAALFGTRVTLIEQGESLELLKKIDALITIASTICVEALAMGIPTRTLVSYTSDLASCFLEKDRSFVEQINSPDFPRSLSPEFNTSEGFIAKHLRPVDGCAAKRAADEVVRLIDKSRACSELKSSCVDISVLTELRGQSCIGNLRSLLRPADLGVEVLAVDASQDGELSRKAESEIQDSRLRVLRFPGFSQAEALNNGLSECRAELIVRFHSSCRALPGMLKGLKKALEMRPDARIALGSYLWRNEVGVSEQIQLLSPGDSLSQIVSGPMANAALVYAFRANPKSVAAQAGAIKENYDLQLMAGLVGELGNPARVVVVPGVSFMSPYSE